MNEFFFNNNDDDDDDDIIGRILRELKPAQTIINNTEPKYVGDRVIVLDYSSVSHLSGEELLPDDYEKIDIDNNQYYIVIDVRKKVEFKSYIQDLVIVNPRTNEKFRVASRHLRVFRKF